MYASRMPFIAKPTPVSDDAAPRDSIGGRPYLPVGAAWPVCETSGKRMVLFFQFDVRAEFALSLAVGSHFAVFMSPDVNEIATFDFVGHGKELPEAFWEKRLQHFKVFVWNPDVSLVAHADSDPYLVPHALGFEEASTAPRVEHLSIGGNPRWIQDPELHPGFDFVCQLSDSFPFLKRESAPKQIDSFSKHAYCLFLGNDAAFFTRAKPTHPEEVWIALQN